jgi:aminomethyltransferase
MSRAILQAAGLTGIETLKFFWLLQGKLGGVPVEVSRTGYTGDLGYEIWIPADQAVTVWDTLMAAGQPYGITPAGLDALDVTRLEAGLILIDVEYHSSQQTLVDARRRTPFELGLDWAVNPRKTGNYLGRRALAREREQGSARKLVGLETQWEQVEALHDKIDLTPELEPGTGRDPSPLYADGHQIGHASSHCWSPILKKHISLGTVETPYAREGSLVEMEYTLEYERHRVQAKIVPRPFFDPPRKRA